MPKITFSKESANKKLESDNRTVRVVDPGRTTHDKSLFTDVCGHEWSASYRDVNQGTGCPECKKVKKVTEGMIRDRLANRSITLVSYAGTVKDKSTFRCDVCLHEWAAKYNGIHSGTGCPKCAGTMRLTEEECHNRLKDGSISMLYYAGKTRFRTSKFECNVCENIWRSSYNEVSQGHGCPKCGRAKSAASKTKFSKELGDRLLKESNRDIEIVTPGRTVSKKTLFICLICKHEWLATFSNVHQGKTGCTSCVRNGYNPNKPGSFYFAVVSTPLGLMIPFGITNNTTVRLKAHYLNLKRCGYEIIEDFKYITLNNGGDISDIEKTIKLHPSNIGMRCKGFYTESLLYSEENKRMIDTIMMNK